MTQLHRFAASIIIGLFLILPADAQHVASPAASSSENTVTDQVHGLTFLKIGSLTGNAAVGYTMFLRSSTGTFRQASASVTVSPRPSVDLSGSFGGRVYLDDPHMSRLRENVVAVDSVPVNGLLFRREYWVVYAGMGMWECVVNCSYLQGQQYYIVSLDASLNAGKPGEVLQGQPLQTEQLRNQIANSLRDEREPLVSQFNALLSSLRINP